MPNDNDLEILKVRPISDLGTPIEIINRFGGKDAFIDAVKEFEATLYEAV